MGEGVDREGLPQSSESTLLPPADGSLDETVAPMDTRAQRLGTPGHSLEVGAYPWLTTVEASHYRLGRTIARGGMGYVLAAQDLRLGREVALKQLLHPSQELRRRLEREARITAGLDHPGIVSVHEAGVWPDGEPFIAMNLVQGESLAKAIDDRPTLEQRLGLLSSIVAAADALAYAHSRQVIHRDLKPHNVLVGAFGQTVVIDWGLAKRLGDPDPEPDGVQPAGAAAAAPAETALGTVMGTLCYMPPEQAEGAAVDTRADVYALGAMLYHVLTGAPPFAGERDLLEAVKRGRPAPLAVRAPSLPPDLVAIAEKAMARAPDDRYPTARELAVDLKKFQTGQLVGAHHYSPWLLLRRWLERRKAIVGLSLASLVALAVVGGISLRRILAEQERTEQQRAAAESHRGEAEDLLGFMLFDLRDPLEAVGKLDLLQAPADKAAAYFARSPATDTPADQRRRAKALSNIGDVLLAKGETGGALTQHRAGLAILARLAAAAPDDVVLQDELGLAHAKVGDVLAQRGERDAAVAAHREAVRVHEAIRDRAELGARRVNLANSYLRLGRDLEEQGDLPGALETFRAARSVAERALADDPSQIGAHQRLASARLDEARVLQLQGQTAEAIAGYRAAVATLTRAVALDEQDAGVRRNLAAAQAKLGGILAVAGDMQGAIAEAHSALAIHALLVDRDPANLGWQRDREVSHLQLADLVFETGSLPEAITEYRAAQAIAERLAAIDPGNATWAEDLASCHVAIGDVLRVQDRGSAALGEYRAAIAILAPLVARQPDSAVLLRSLGVQQDRIGEQLLSSGDPDGALAQFLASLAIAEKLAARDPSNALWQEDLATSHTNVADAHLARRDVGSAMAALEAARPIRERLSASDPESRDARRSLALLHDRIGDLYLERGEVGPALERYGKALPIVSQLAADDPTNTTWQSDVALTQRNIGDARARQRDLVGACAAYDAAIAIARAQAARDPSDDRWRALVGELSASMARPCARRR